MTHLQDVPNPNGTNPTGMNPTAPTIDACELPPQSSLNVLVLPPFDDEQRAHIQGACPEACFVYVPHEKVTPELAEHADIVIGNLPTNLLGHARRLRLLQLNSAGYDNYLALDPGTLPRELTLCNATGAYGPAVSETLFAMVFSLMKRLPSYQDDQRAHVWSDHGMVTSFGGSNVLVLGAGDIGTHFAQLAWGMGACVTGIRHRETPASRPFTRIASIDNLYDLLPEADVVASFLPSTSETDGLADEKFFSLMKPGAFFANGGRGSLVDQWALMTALKSGHLAGAALDVCTPEPLPASNPLWDAPNLLLTPHISGTFHMKVTLDRIAEIAAENLTHFVAGEPLRNVVLQ